MTAGKALGITGAVVVVVGIFLALALWLGITEYWAGFLFLTQWGLMEQVKIDRLPYSVGGAIVGTAIALLPSQLPPLVGATPTLMIMLPVVLLTIYCTIVGWLPMFVNAAAMIFLTVVTIPHIAQNASPVGILAGLAAGVIFFGGLALIVDTFVMRQQRSPAPER